MGHFHRYVRFSWLCITIIISAWVLMSDFSVSVLFALVVMFIIDKWSHDMLGRGWDVS